MTTTRFTDRDLAEYERDGFFIVRGLFDRGEIDKLLRFAQEDPSFASGLAKSISRMTTRPSSRPPPSTT